MSEMIERVSAIINHSGHCDWKLETCRAGDCQCMALASAVIEGLRKPSVALLNKLEDLLDTHGREQLLEDSWSDLIDAVLK